MSPLLVFIVIDVSSIDCSYHRLF